MQQSPPGHDSSENHVRLSLRPSGCSTSAAAAMGDWTSLPPELRFMVLEHLATTRLEFKKVHHIFAGYTTVCKEWNSVLEPENFKALKIASTEIAHFSELVRGPRRRWLRNLRFHVILPSYKNKLRFVPETEDEQDQNNRNFTNSIWELFEVMSHWQAGDDSEDAAAAAAADNQLVLSQDQDTSSTRGISLEIRAFSPSDKKQFWGEAGLKEDGTNRFFDFDLQFDFSEVPELKGSQGLPEVDVITGLRILRRNRRTVAPYSVLGILSSLPQVEEFIFEPWHQVDEEEEADIDLEFAQTVAYWPRSLRKLVIFEHADAFLRGPYPEGDPPGSCPLLARNLARLSQGMDEFSSCSFGDISVFLEQFFQPVPSKSPRLLYWDRLQRLTMTAEAFCVWSGNEASPVDCDSAAINNTLFAAGRAAKRMPKLRLMQVFHADSYAGAVFAYRADSGTTSITWKSTFEFAPDNEVKQLWGAVSRAATQREPVVIEELLTNYEGFFKFLEAHIASQAMIVHPTSAHDMLTGKPPVSEAATQTQD